MVFYKQNWSRRGSITCASPDYEQFSIIGNGVQKYKNRSEVYRGVTEGGITMI